MSNAPDGAPHLLLIEDDRDTLVASAHLLAAGGFSVEIARGGEDGIAKAIRLRPDVIVTDVVMPNTTGCDVCQRLHDTAETRNIPVIAYTGLTDAHVLAQLFRLGVRVFAIKPCVPDVIANEAHALLEHRYPGAIRIVTAFGETLDNFAREVEAHVLQTAP
jgi:CheY-like chemotaxis protein